jgi:hypothetical protein
MLTPRLERLLRVWCITTSLSMSSSALTLGQSWLGTDAVPLLELGATGLGVALLLPFREASMGDECASDILTSSAT